MSNPVATIGNTIPGPEDPKVERKTYSSILFENQKFYWYSEGEYSPTYASFDPSDKGQRFFIFVLLYNALGVRPEFVGEESWETTVKRSGSGFLTGRFSIMPKVFVPSTILVDNGIQSPGLAYAAYADAATSIEAFNWNLQTLNGTSIPVTELIKYGQIGAYFGSQYVSIRAKDDATGKNEMKMQLVSPPTMGGSAPSPGPEGWDTGHELVVDGAFIMLLNVVPSRPGTVDYAEVQENPWSLKFEFGDVIMEMNEVGAMKVNYTAGADREENVVTVNLAEGKTKEGPPQQQHIDDKQPYVILVYPVWNGIIIMSGNQDSPEVVKQSSTYIPMKRGRSVLLAPYSTGFDPSSPAPVEVGTGTGATNTIPSFGTQMNITATNVRFELAYLPCFFSREMWFDEWFVANDDIPGQVDYTYNVYPIWTANGTSAVLGPTTPTMSGTAGPVVDTTYWYVQWRLAMSAHDRYAGEVFGSILEIIEEEDFPIKNDNGNFDLIWSGGSPGDPNPGSWENYIQSLSATVSLDGSSGSVSVDKYGVAGQDAVATQSIGAFTIDMTGGFGTVAGSIFQGLALGTSEQASSDGATWEIPLIGLEKKLEDILLINVPFFDGETLKTAMDFLTKYAGLNVDYSNAPNAAADRLSVSEDVNVPRFDWKSGTSVRSAIEDCMNDLNYEYVVRDGVVYVYELNNFGLPVFTGPDWEPSYPDTKLILENQTPDFEDLRNKIVVTALKQVPEGSGSNIKDVPLWPRFERRDTITTPDIPWAKTMFQAISGALDEPELSAIADNFQQKTANYLVIGRTTVPGNANIKPYDRWGSLYIISVTHNIDFNAKTWTTDIEFASGT
jgi:hypothetical protein